MNDAAYGPGAWRLPVVLTEATRGITLPWLARRGRWMMLVHERSPYLELARRATNCDHFVFTTQNCSCLQISIQTYTIQAGRKEYLQHPILPYMVHICFSFSNTTSASVVSFHRSLGVVVRVINFYSRFSVNLKDWLMKTVFCLLFVSPSVMKNSVTY